MKYYKLVTTKVANMTTSKILPNSVKSTEKGKFANFKFKFLNFCTKLRQKWDEENELDQRDVGKLSKSKPKRQ